MAERHVGELIGEVFRRGGMVRSVRKAEAVIAWPRVAGPELARFSRARALRGGVLFVDVSDSETAMHLSMQRARFLAAYERRLGRREVKDIRFVAGRPAPEPAPAEAPPPAEPDPDEWRAVARRLGELDLPQALAEPTLAAARAMLAHRRRARAAGWTPCPHCGALSPDPGPCDACRRHRAAPAVRAHAEALTVDPAAQAAALGEEERAVARALAVEALDARLAELLPQVLASPALRPQLARAARHRLALAEGRPVGDVEEAETARLDPRIARALGRWGGADPSEGGPDER
jgi:hypothetical protein